MDELTNAIKNNDENFFKIFKNEYSEIHANYIKHGCCSRCIYDDIDNKIYEHLIKLFEINDDIDKRTIKYLIYSYKIDSINKINIKIIKKCLKLINIFIKNFDINKLLELDDKYHNNYFYILTLIFYKKLSEHDNDDLERNFMKNRYDLDKSILLYIHYLCYKNNFEDLNEILDKLDYTSDRYSIDYAYKLFETKDEIKKLKEKY